MSLSGRVALVTGGSRGIGSAICEGLAADGAIVAVNYSRDEEAAQQTVAAIEAQGGQAKAYQANVNDAAQVAAMVKAVEADFGPIGILVNNAGVASRGKTVADTDPAEMERLLAIHAIGPFLVSQAVLPGMRTLERGDIVITSSVATRSFMLNGAPYNMGKAAGEALAYTLAKEEQRHNIYVNVVAPGLVATDMGTRLAKATLGTGDTGELDANFPFGHVCRPEEVANVVRFFVSPQNTYVTGQRLYVDGGSQRY